MSIMSLSVSAITEHLNNAAFSLLLLASIVTTASEAMITESPVSVTTLGGTDAMFHCAGSGVSIAWIVDELPSIDQSILDRGISDNAVSSSGTVQSTLTVPATSVNNGTTVQCVISSALIGGIQVASNYSTLTILPGIGPVTNVRFTPSFSFVAWEPPATAGVLSDLSYIVIVMNNNTGQVIVSGTTNSTSYPLPVGLYIPCQYYTANVTAFSSQHHSDSVIIGQRVPGDYYDLASVPRIVVASYNLSQSEVTFTVSIVERSTQVCPGQDLMSITYPRSNSADRSKHDEMPLVYAGEVNYTVTVTTGYLCACDIKIIFDGREEVDFMTVFFSSYNVQSCVVSSDQHTSSILVECTFAINSTAPGIVVIQDDQSQYTINKTLQRLVLNSDKGTVNITGLPAGEYSVRVYDNSPATDTSAAYQHSQLIHIMELHQPSSTTLSQSTVDTTATSIAVTTLYTSDSPTTTAVVSTDIAMLTIPAIIGTIVASIITTITTLSIVVICLMVRKYNKTKLAPLAIVYRQESQNSYVSRNEFGQQIIPKEPVYADFQHSTNPPAPPLPVEPVQYATVKKQTDNTVTMQLKSTPKTNFSDSGVSSSFSYEDSQVNQHSTSTEEDAQNFDLYHSTNPPAPPLPAKPEPVYAGLQHSANPPAPSLPVESVQYADIMKQADNTVTTQTDEGLHYAQVKHSTNPPTPRLPVEPVQYTTVKKPQSTTETIQYKNNGNKIFHEETSTGVYSASVPSIEDHTAGLPTESTGLDKAIFSTPASLPRDSQLIGTSIGTKDTGDQLSWSANQPTDVTNNGSLNEPVIPQPATVNTNNTTPVVQPGRGGDVPSTNGDNQTGSVQHFQDVSNDALSVEESSSPAEDEDFVVPATHLTRIAASEVTSLRMGVHSGMEQNDSVTQAKLLVNAEKPVEIDENHEVVIGNSSEINPKNDLQSIESLSVSDAFSTVEQTSVSEQQEKIKAIFPRASCFVFVINNFISYDLTLENCSCCKNHDDVLQSTFTLASKLSVFVSGCSGAGKNNLVCELVETAKANSRMARVLVSYQHQTSGKTCKTTLPKSSEEFAEDGCYSDDSEFVSLDVFQQHIEDEKYANTKQLVVFADLQNFERLLESDFFTHVVVDEKAQLREVPSLLKMANSSTNMDESDKNSSTLSDDSLSQPVSGSPPFFSPPTLSLSDDLTCAMSSNETPAVESDEEAVIIKCTSVATTNSAQNEATTSDKTTASLETDAEPTLHTAWQSHNFSAFSAAFRAFSSPVASKCSKIICYPARMICRNIADELQVLECSFIQLRTKIQGLVHFYDLKYGTEKDLLSQLHQSHVDVFNTSCLEKAAIWLEREDVNSLIEDYKRKRDRFMGTTTVLEFQQAVSNTAALADPEEEESIKIAVSKNWAKEKTLTDVTILAQKVFGDKYKSFINFNVVPSTTSFLITWSFPKRLEVELQQVVVSNAAVFQQEDVFKVTVGDFTSFTHESNCEIRLRYMYKDFFKRMFSKVFLLPITDPDRNVVNQSQGSFRLRFSWNYSKILQKSHRTVSLPLYTLSLTVRELAKVCRNVKDWYTLGIHLRLSMSQLDDIRRNYSHLGTETMKRMMFEVWLRSTPGASWDDMITALREIGEGYVASMIANNSVTGRELAKMCRNVKDWFMLGIHLGLSVRQLDDIHRRYSHLGTETMMKMMFEVWSRSTPGASWADLITALREIGAGYVVSMLALNTVSAKHQKYTPADVVLIAKRELGTSRAISCLEEQDSCDYKLKCDQLQTGGNLSAKLLHVLRKMNCRTPLHLTNTYGLLNTTQYLTTEQACNSIFQFSTSINDHASLLIAFLIAIEQHSLLPLHAAYQMELISDFINCKELVKTTEPNDKSGHVQILSLPNPLTYSSGITELQSDPKFNSTNQSVQEDAVTLQQNETEPSPDQKLIVMQSSLKVTDHYPISASLFSTMLQEKNTQSMDCSHDMWSGYGVMPGSVSRKHAQSNFFTIRQLCFEQWFQNGLKDENTDIVGRKITQLKASLKAIEEHNSKGKNAYFQLYKLWSTSNISKNTNKSDLLYAAGRAVCIGAASLISDMELLVSRCTETLSSISGVSSAMWSYSMIPTVSSFTDQLAGGGLLQLIC